MLFAIADKNIGEKYRYAKACLSRSSAATALVNPGNYFPSHATDCQFLGETETQYAQVSYMTVKVSDVWFDIYVHFMIISWVDTFPIQIHTFRAQVWHYVDIPFLSPRSQSRKYYHTQTSID